MNHSQQEPTLAKWTELICTPNKTSFHLVGTGWIGPYNPFVLITFLINSERLKPSESYSEP